MEPQDALLEAAQEAYRQLAEAEDTLRSAGHWGLFDLLGGGILAGHFKHKRADQVRSSMRRARRALERVNEASRELGLSIASTSGLDRSEHSRTRTIDVWLDDPFTDFTFHRKVKSMRRAIEQSRKQLDRVVADLDRSEAKGPKRDQ